ncbi:MAG: hypothetical protein AAF401_13980 [Pseudomonadota bacterium]
MRRLRAWIEDRVGGAIAEVEAMAPQTPPTEIARVVLGGRYDDSAAQADAALDQAECLTIRRPVRAGARFYLKSIGRTIVETSWPFAHQTPIWTTVLERQGREWEIVVHVLRADRVEEIKAEASLRLTPIRRLWLNNGAGPPLDIEPQQWRQRARAAAAAVMLCLAIGAPLTGVANGLNAIAAIDGVAERARVAAEPIRAALRNERVAASANEALLRAATQPGLSNLLYDLAQPLPDVARLKAVAIRENDIRLEGRAPSAAAVLAAYADAAGLSNVRFDGPVSAIPSGGERFSIVAERAGSSDAAR